MGSLPAVLQWIIVAVIAAFAYPFICFVREWRKASAKRMVAKILIEMWEKDGREVPESWVRQTRAKWYEQ